MSVRPREEENNATLGGEQQGPSPPQLMGGDGSVGAGVAAETQSTTKNAGTTPAATPVDAPKQRSRSSIVVLRLHNPDKNNDTEAKEMEGDEMGSDDDDESLCCVECKRNVIASASNLIKNLLDNIGDDEMLPPFSTEHIADERTLLRVVHFARMQGNLKENYGDRWLFKYVKRELWFQLAVIPCQKHFCPSVRRLFFDYIEEDGDRGGILNLLMAAHYLCFEKLKNASAAFCAMLIDAWASAGIKEHLFGPPGRFGTAEDPLCKVPVSVLAEIANRSVNIIADAKPLHQFSATLFKTIAQLDRVWENFNENHCSQADFHDSSCHICLAMEQRLAHNPRQLFAALVSRADLKSTYNPRWKDLVSALTERSAEAFLTNRSMVPPTSLTTGVQLSNASSLHMAILAKAVAIDPSAMVYLPRIPHGVGAIAACWKDFYNFGTREATSVSIELVPSSSSYTHSVQVDQLLSVLARPKRITTLQIREGEGKSGRLTKKSVVPSSVGAMLETSPIQNLSLRLENFPPFLDMLPSCLKGLEIRNVEKSLQLKKIFQCIFGDPEHALTLELSQLIVDGSSETELNFLGAYLKEFRVQERYQQKRLSLHIYLRKQPRFLEDVEKFVPQISFYHETEDITKRFASSSKFLMVSPPSFMMKK